MSFIIMQISLTYYSLDVTIHFASFGLKMTLYYRLDTPIVRHLVCFHSWYVNFYLFFILYNKNYVVMPVISKGKVT